MDHLMNILNGLLVIRTKLPNPLIVTRGNLVHVPEAILSLFNGTEKAAMLSYGWEEHAAEKGYVYRFNGVVSPLT